MDAPTTHLAAAAAGRVPILGGEPRSPEDGGSMTRVIDVPLHIGMGTFFVSGRRKAPRTGLTPKEVRHARQRATTPPRSP